MISTGVDIVSIDRISKSLKNPRFLNHVYGEGEISLYHARGENPSFLAGNFAAKEAFSKALSTGVRGFSLCEVEVLRGVQGSPFFALSGKAKQIAEETGYSFSLSISHEKEYAIAFVVAYK